MLAIRTDGNSNIGIGHIMRCLTIAYDVKKMKEDVMFIVSDEISEHLLLGKGFPILNLHTSWNNLDNELNNLISHLKALSIRKIVVDSYFATTSYLSKLQEYFKTIYIDDLNNCKSPISAVINYGLENTYNNPYLHFITQKFCSPKYIPLRTQFQNLRPNIREAVNEILISTGGSDSYNFAGFIIFRLLEDDYFKNINIHVVSGLLNPHISELMKIAEKHPHLSVHQNVSNMAELMLSCDIAVTAGGSTIYELCACGVPSIIFSWADNQIYGAVEFSRRGIIEYAGDMRTDSEKCVATIISLLKKYISDTELRRKCSERMRTVTDGNGALRIAEEIMKL